MGVIPPPAQDCQVFALWLPTAAEPNPKLVPLFEQQGQWSVGGAEAQSLAETQGDKLAAILLIKYPDGPDFQAALEAFNAIYAGNG